MRHEKGPEIMAIGMKIRFFHFHAQNHAQRALVESDEFLTSKNNNQFLSPISCLEYVIVLTGVLVPLVSQVWVRFSPIIGKVGAIFKIAPTF